MKKNIIIAIIAATGLFSCKQGSKSTPDSVVTETLDAIKNARSTKPLKAFIHTEYEYTDSMGESMVIENSFPKSGIHYTDPKGKEYIYAVFFTRITNESENALEAAIDFPVDSFELPSASGNYIKLLLPSDTITGDKEPLYDYGLAVKSFLNGGIHSSSSLKRIINPKKSSGFYVVTLSRSGVNGTLRTGLSLKEQNLFYSINGKEIPCGKINLKK